MISEITTAIAGGIGPGKLAAVIHPYPTQTEAIRRPAVRRGRRYGRRRGGGGAVAGPARSCRGPGRAQPGHGALTRRGGGRLHPPRRGLRVLRTLRVRPPGHLLAAASDARSQSLNSGATSRSRLPALPKLERPQRRTLPEPPAKPPLSAGPSESAIPGSGHKDSELQSHHGRAVLEGGVRDAGGADLPYTEVSSRLQRVAGRARPPD